jgi:hypothetical protein
MALRLILIVEAFVKRSAQLIQDALKVQIALQDIVLIQNALKQAVQMA